MKKDLISVGNEVQLGKRTLEIVNYYFDHPKLTQEQIAKDLGISGPRVNQVLNHPKVRKAFPLIAKRRVNDRLLPKAMKAYEEIIDQTDSVPAREKAAARVISDSKVFDSPVIEVKNTLELKPTEELIELIRRNDRAELPSVDTEVVPDDSTPA